MIFKPAKSRQNFNVLSLSGGGYMGLYTAKVLAHLEELKGHPIGKSFDLVVGTSVGGILALAVAHQVPMRDVVRVLEEKGNLIFPAPSGQVGKYKKARSFLGLFGGSKYSSDPLRNMVENFLPSNLKMGELSQRTAICGTNISTGLPYTFRTPHLAHHSHSGLVPCVDVALATSAAPIYMPLHKIEDELYCDGGIYANSPDLVALHEAESLCGVPIEEINMLSIGTTTSHYNFGRVSKLTLGVGDWILGNRIVKVVMSAQQNHVHRVCSGRLRERYHRIDEYHRPDQMRNLGLDLADVSAQQALNDLAKISISKLNSNLPVNQIIEHNAKPVRVWYHQNTLKPRLV